MHIFLIAEIGINHNGSVEIAEQLIAAAADAGFDAVKFQKRTLEKVYSKEVLDSPRESPWGTAVRDLPLRRDLAQQRPGASAPEKLDTYLRECHGWPRSRPSTFRMADALMELLDVPTGSRAIAEIQDNADVVHTLKRRLYRHVPSAALIPGARTVARALTARDRQLLRRYHYSPWLYPHEAEVSNTFAALLRLTVQVTAN